MLAFGCSLIKGISRSYIFDNRTNDSYILNLGVEPCYSTGILNLHSFVILYRIIKFIHYCAFCII